MDPLLFATAGLAFIAIAGVGLALAGAAEGSGKLGKRAQVIAQRGRMAAQNGLRNAQTDAAARRKQIQRTLQEQGKQRRAAALDIGAKLRQAGLSVTVKNYWLASAASGLVVAALALFLHAKLPVALMLGFVFGLGVPIWILGFLAKRRAAKFGHAFADAVDIIVRGLRSGLPLHDCLKVIGKESPEPLSGEFRRLVEGLSVGVTLDQGLDRMHERMPTPELKFFAIVLAIQQKTGGNLGEALGNLSAVLRGRRLMREKIKALSSEAVASAAVIGCLPPGVGALISVVNPGYFNPMIHDPRGHLMLAVGAGIMAFGIFVMRKMINFKF